MSDRKGPNQSEPTPALRENRVLAEPATVDACAKDYAAAAADRRAVDNHIRHGR